MSDKKLAAIIAIWVLAALLSLLAWASIRGFDDSMCRAHNACPWRDT